LGFQDVGFRLGVQSLILRTHNTAYGISGEGTRWTVARLDTAIQLSRRENDKEVCSAHTRLVQGLDERDAGREGGHQKLDRFRANVAHARQSGPESGPGFQAKQIKPFMVFPFRSAAGLRERDADERDARARDSYHTADYNPLIKSQPASRN